MSYDADLRLVYFSTGQPAPWSTAVRGPGDALYTNTVLAVDAQTGKIRWHFQLNPADDWDRAGYENMLVDLQIGGRARKALIQTGKMGWGVVLDRETGEFLHAFKTAYDNVVTRMDAERASDRQSRADSNARRHRLREESSRSVHTCTARETSRRQAIARSRRLYYLGVNNSCMEAKVVSIPYVPGRAYTGVTLTAKRAPGYDYVGEFVAFDPVTGTRAWTYRAPGGAAMTASALATAGGVVFGGTADRQFFALDTDTGKLLWQTRLNGDVSGAPITFTVDGTAVRRDHSRRADRADDIVRSADRRASVRRHRSRSGFSPFPRARKVSRRAARRQRPCSDRPPVSHARHARANDHAGRCRSNDDRDVYERPGASR